MKPADGTLTIECLRQIIDGFNDKRVGEDADAFIRLGAEGYKAFRILKHGGLVVVGGHRRGGSVGLGLVEKLRSDVPSVRVRLTELLPDGQICLLDTSGLL